ncbi:DUF4362 domain-containing protein [Sporosarcina sp.]|uniref:DUF4362 domain-containing protein n=1 Tax=Sporosarcina sp. TaxID=49982 RepID=UPI002608B61F|nr:DUF4362 domain-containing protein [Sporosarcina sp.]
MRKVFPLLLFAVILTACNRVKDSDIVFEQEEITSNLDKLEEFIKNVENENEDKIRIVRRTIEGDPIFDTLDYNGESITYTHDDSHDKFGGSDKGTESGTCENLESKTSERGMKYYLTECSSETGKHFDFEIPE